MRLCAAVALICVGFASTAWSGVRPPAVAGSFYTSDPERLERQIDSMLVAAAARPGAAPARALVVPHAGYVFSGPTAALAFARLPDSGIRRVVLLGPSHHLPFAGAALPAPGVDGFATPLGTVALDTDAISTLRGREHFDGPARAHDLEHSLEVQLPFLQAVVPDARLVPIVVGGETDLELCLAMAESIARLLDEETAVIASSDFTHHGRRYGWTPYVGRDLPDVLLEVGRGTAGRVAAGDPRGLLRQVDVSGDTVCGIRPLGVLAALIERAFSGRGEVLDVTTSGHVTGSFDLSVTYAAVGFSGVWTEWRPVRPPADPVLDAEAGGALIELARASLRSRLVHDASLAGWFATHADEDRALGPAGAFVTLNRLGVEDGEPGRLRACMGMIEADQPALDAVIQAAVWATRDPRFPPLEAEELDDITVEISVLSPLRPVASHRDIEVGTHGVVLSKGRHRSVFLPQVATEQGWDRRTMLDHLAIKAGLPADGWRRGARFEVFTAQVFGEPP